MNVLVVITNKDCAEISTLQEYFPIAQHNLCQFHVLKAVNVRLTKKVYGKGLKEEEKTTESNSEKQCMRNRNWIMNWRRNINLLA